MKNILYYFFKVFVKSGFFFYAKKIKVSGKENIPKKGAVLFMANHPNGLIDPIIIATNIPRKTNFLVQAAVFKNKNIATFFGWLGMMPIYRIRDGIKQLSKNDAIFESCKNLLEKEQAILIFPEGSQNAKRTVRSLSKGFTRILYRTLDTNKDLQIHIVPVGITYQNIGAYPSKFTIQYGEPILANNFYNSEEKNASTKILKQQVSKQLKELSVHISDDENFDTKLQKLNASQTDFTEVEKVNWMIEKNTFLSEKKPKAELKWLKFLIVLNSILLYFIWKKVETKIKIIEYIDTFKFTMNLFLFPIFYIIKACIVCYFFGIKTAVIYFIASVLLVLIYTKLSPTNTKASKQV